MLLTQLAFSKSSYYYQKSVSKKCEKYSNIRKRIVEFFHENKERYGYRRIYGLLKREGITVSEKEVRRIMQENN